MELQEAATAYDASSLSLDEMRSTVAEMIAKGVLDDQSRLMIAFRNGTEIAEEDLRSLLEDCRELQAQLKKSK
jgi:predicted AAA+ superfamily ATPase